MFKKSLTKLGLSTALATASCLMLSVGSAHALVHTNDIADGAVTTAKIANAAITTEKLTANAVRTSKIVNGGVTSDDIKNGTVRGTDLSSDIAVASDVTRATGATGSFQNLAGDLTYEGGAGGTSSFHAGVMGHFHGSTLSNTAAGYHAGVIGAYSVATSDGLTGAKAGVIGTIGVDGDASGAADAAVMAVIDGGDPGAVITGNAAYGVQYLNATAGAKFSYGLDLSHAAVSPYPAVSYSTADIRLAVGTTIASGTTGNRPSSCVKGSIYLNTTTGIPDACTATNTWTALDLTD